MLGKHDLKIFEILFEMYKFIMIIRGYCMVLYGTVMLYDFVSYVVHFLAASIFMSEVHQIGRLGGVYPKQGTCSRRGNRTRTSFQTSLLKIVPYCYIMLYIYIAFILWLHDVMSCYNMLRYLGLMRDDDLESSLLEGCVETSTC